MDGVGSTNAAELLKFQLFSGVHFILFGRVSAVTALLANQVDENSR